MRTRRRFGANTTLSEADRFVLSQVVTSPGVFSAPGVQTWLPVSWEEPRARWVSYGEGIRFTVESDSFELPRWLEPTLRSFADLVNLPPNWDSYGGRPIEHRAINEALNVLTSIMEDSTPAPSVVPTSEGGLQLEWHVAGVDLEIALPVSGSAEISCEGPSSSWEGELSPNMSRLRSVVARLSS